MNIHAQAPAPTPAVITEGNNSAEDNTNSAGDTNSADDTDSAGDTSDEEEADGSSNENSQVTMTCY